MKLLLEGIQTIGFGSYLDECLNRDDFYHVAIVTSGYESRSTYWTRQLESSCVSKHIDAWLVVGFAEKREELNRPVNDAFYGELGLPVTVAEETKESFISKIKDFIEISRGHAKGKAISVHVDYSCMPRTWYCELPGLLQGLLLANEFFSLWYSAGIYQTQEYPTAGVNDFQIFSGRPSLGTVYRTHLFGLGFDKIRSQAIQSVIDPQNLVCFFADNGAAPEYLEKVQTDNSAVIAANMFNFTAPLNDFVSALSRIRSVVIDLLDSGDVIIVPDGPKPLILASSIIPLSIDRIGAVCFHVRRRRDADIGIVDVVGDGVPSGFLLYGARE